LRITFPVRQPAHLDHGRVGRRARRRTGLTSMTTDDRSHSHASTLSSMKPAERPVIWNNRDLSVPGAIARYHGKCHVRPIGRGVVLSDLEMEPQLDDLLESGDYEIEIRVVRRIPATTP